MASTPPSHPSAILSTPPSSSHPSNLSTPTPDSPNSADAQFSRALEKMVTPAYMRPTLSSEKKISQARHAYLKRKSTYNASSETYNDTRLAVPDHNNKRRRNSDGAATLSLLSPRNTSPCNTPTISPPLFITPPLSISEDNSFEECKIYRTWAVDAIELAGRLRWLPVKEVGMWRLCMEGGDGIQRVEEDGKGKFVKPWQLMRRLGEEERIWM